MTAFQLDSISGEWSINVAPDIHEADKLLVVFKCLNKETVKAIYENCGVILSVENQDYDMGLVTDCMAKVKIPNNVDLTQGIHVKVTEKQ